MMDKLLNKEPFMNWFKIKTLFLKIIMMKSQNILQNNFEIYLKILYF